MTTDDKSNRFADRISAARRQSGASTGGGSTGGTAKPKARRPSNDGQKKQGGRRSSGAEDFKNMDPSDIVAMLEMYASVDGATCSTVMGCLKDGSSASNDSKRAGSKRRGSKRPSVIQKTAAKMVAAAGEAPLV